MKHAMVKLTALALGVAWAGTGFSETAKTESLLGDLASSRPEQPAEVAKPAGAAEPAPKAKPVEAEKVAEAAKPIEAEKTVEKVQPAEAETDEIDLNADDSAEAAKGRPVVKLAPPDAKPTAAEPVAAGPVKEAVAPEGVVPSAPSATGTDIAAKFLASDETALVDIMSDDASLTDILRQFRKATGANIIYAESTNLQQRVSVSLKHVPWLQAMRSILNSRGFRVESSGGIHFVKEDKLVDPVFTRTFQLNHASVDELAALFNENYGLKDKSGKLIHGIATPFSGANTVVVTAPDRVLADCEAIIKAVDKAVPQIYIEARFIELSNEAMHKLGVQWNQLESWGASVRDLQGGMEYNNGHVGTYGYSTKSGGFSHNGSIGHDGKNEDSFSSSFTSGAGAPGTSSGTSSIGSSRSSSMSVSRSYSSDSSRETFTSPSAVADAAGRSMNWLNARGFSGQLSADDFRLAMSAFEQLDDTRIFSNPRVIVSNGKEAHVDMTTKFPNVRVTATRNTSNGSDSLDISTQLEVIPGEDKLMFAKEPFFSWGITLSVRPRISPDGLISVEIVPTISQLDTDVSSTGFYQVRGGDSSAYSSYPIIMIKRITTDFTMKDGATAVIGGLSKTEEGDIDSGIPYLRKIPWVGPKLFGWKKRGKVQKEILVFVTLGIADPANLPEDVGLPKNAVRGREYVEKRAFEPGDRPNAANETLKLDMRLLDEQAKDREKENAEAEAKKNDDDTRGTVVITPVIPEKEP